MIEVSRDGKRVYVTNSLYTPWDSQFYPDGIRGWMAKVNVDPAEAWRSTRLLPRQRRDAAPPGSTRRRRRLSDSFCYA